MSDADDILALTGALQRVEHQRDSLKLDAEKLASENARLAAEVERLTTRQQELLATIVRVTNETPYPRRDQGLAVAAVRDDRRGRIAQARDAAVRERDEAREDARVASAITRESIVSYLRRKATVSVTCGNRLLSAADDIESDDTISAAVRTERDQARAEADRMRAVYETCRAAYDEGARPHGQYRAWSSVSVQKLIKVISEHFDAIDTATKPREES